MPKWDRRGLKLKSRQDKTYTQAALRGAAALDEAADDPMLGEEVPSGKLEPTEEEEAEGKEMTRGKLLQRHKREYRAMRHKESEIRLEAKKLSKHDVQSKSLRRQMIRDIRSEYDAMSARQERELAQFDDAQREKALAQAQSEVDTVSRPVMPDTLG